MMKKFLTGVILSLVLLLGTGCGSSNDSKAPVYQEVNESISTYKYDISNAGGEVEVKYVGLDNGGDTSFIVTHAIDGVGYDIYFPTAFSTNNLLYVSTIVSIPANTSDDVVVNTIEIKYFTDLGSETVSVIDVTQKTFEDEITIIVNVDINNTLVIDTNGTFFDDNNTVDDSNASDVNTSVQSAI